MRRGWRRLKNCWRRQKAPAAEIHLEVAAELLAREHLRLRCLRGPRRRELLASRKKRPPQKAAATKARSKSAHRDLLSPQARQLPRLRVKIRQRLRLPPLRAAKSRSGKSHRCR